jgi:hypothetical protein
MFARLLQVVVVSIPVCLYLISMAARVFCLLIIVFVFEWWLWRGYTDEHDRLVKAMDQQEEELGMWLIHDAQTICAPDCKSWESRTLSWLDAESTVHKLRSQQLRANAGGIRWLLLTPLFTVGPLFGVQQVPITFHRDVKVYLADVKDTLWNNRLSIAQARVYLTVRDRTTAK